jgi:hypothetical protein
VAANSISRIPVKFVAEGVGEAEGELIRHLSPRTVDSILKKLPIEGRVALWKEEVYFEIPVTMGEEKPRATASKGDVAYWPMGHALCVFYGRTQPYSPVNAVGRILKNLELFGELKSGTVIQVLKV